MNSRRLLGDLAMAGWLIAIIFPIAGCAPFQRASPAFPSDPRAELAAGAQARRQVDLEIAQVRWEQCLRYETARLARSGSRTAPSCDADEERVRAAWAELHTGSDASGAAADSFIDGLRSALSSELREIHRRNNYE